MRDFDRPLNAAGRLEADAIGATMLDAGYLPDRVICSNAKRARETWDAVARYLRATNDVVFTDQLYIADAAGYANVVADNAEIATLLLVGHNPMIEDVCFAMAPGGRCRALQRISGKRAGGRSLSGKPGRCGPFEGEARRLHHAGGTVSRTIVQGLQHRAALSKSARHCLYASLLGSG